MDMQKNQIKQLEKEGMCISLKQFLISFCGISDESVKDIKMSHKDIKELMPDLKRISYEELLYDKSVLYYGEVILVKDSYGGFAPYVKPEIIESTPLSFDHEFSCNNKIESSEKPNRKETIYDLTILCNQLKKYRRYKDYKEACSKLKEIELGTKSYKRRKLELKIGGKYND